MRLQSDRKRKRERCDGDLLDNHDSREADGLHETEEVHSTSLDVT